MRAPRSRVPKIADADIRLLRVFLAVVRNKGFAAAQDDLGVSQGTISIQIAQLEHRLAMRLCERGRSGFSLTDEGKVVSEAAQNLLRSIENFRSIIESLRGELTGEVHFGTVDAMYTNEDLPLQQAFESFAKLAPKVVVHTDIASPQDLVQGLLNDHYHLILVPVQRLPRPLRAITLFEERQSLYCGSSHKLFRVAEEKITTKMLSEHRYAARSYMPGWGGPLNVSFKNSAIASHMESIALFILSGQYFGYLPAHFAAQWVDRGEMRCLLDSKMSYRDKFYLAHSRQEKNRLVMALFDCIHSCAVDTGF
jgi:DNA-binding transcriptional LysR family regulator